MLGRTTHTLIIKTLNTLETQMSITISLFFAMINPHTHQPTKHTHQLSKRMIGLVSTQQPGLSTIKILQLLIVCLVLKFWSMFSKSCLSNQKKNVSSWAHTPVISLFQYPRPPQSSQHAFILFYLSLLSIFSFSLSVFHLTSLHS